MAIAMIEILFLAFFLTLLAALTARIIQSKKTGNPKKIIILVYIILGFPLCLNCLIAVLPWIWGLSPTVLIPFCIVSVVVYFAAGWWIIYYGRAIHKDEPRAKNWPAGVLLNSAFIILLAFCTLFTVVDLHRKTELSWLGEQAADAALSLWPAKPVPGQNAIDYYDRASALFSSLTVLERRLDTTKVELSMPDWIHSSDKILLREVGDQETRILLSEFQPVLEWFDQGLEKQSFYYPIDTQNLLGQFIPVLRPIQDMAALKCLHIQELAHNVDFGLALEEWRKLEALSNQLLDVPTVINAMSAVRIEYDRSRMLEKMLALAGPETAFDDSWLGGWEFLFQEYVDQWIMMEIQSLKHGLALGALNSELLLPSFGVEFTGPDILINFYGAWYRVFLAPGDIQIMTQLQNDMHRDVYKDWPSKREQYQKNHEQLEKNILKGLFSSIAMPQLTRYPVRFASMTTLKYMCELALAATSYQLKNDAYPDSLDQLFQEYPKLIAGERYFGNPVQMEQVEGGIRFFAGSEKEPPEVDFYLGKEAYENFRLQPLKKAKIKKKK